MRTLAPLRLALQLCLLPLAATLAQAQFNFTLTPLPPLGGGYTSSYPYGISASGQVLGESNTGAGAAVATLWTGGIATSLPTPGTYDYAWATAANATGSVIVGGKDAETNSDALVWTWNGTGYNSATSLLTLGGTYAYASGINGSGQIVGSSSVSGSSPTHATIWTWNGTTSTYDATDLDPAGATDSWANSLNTAGRIVGASGTQAVTWNWNATAYVATALPGGGNSEAYAINDAGQIAGRLNGQAALWNWNGSAYATVVDLNTLGNVSSHARGINASGVVVGSASTGGGNYAFIYAGGTMHDLNDYVQDLPLNWTLTDAVGINDAGQITGTAAFGGNSYGFLLTPAAIPEPSTYAALLGLGACLAVAFKRRRARGLSV